VAERIPLQVNRNPFNESYLSTKAAKLGHWLKERI
jgi:GTP cyclohydrolase II